MYKTITLTFLAIFLTLSNNSKAQELEWVHETNMDTLTYPGTKHTIIQLCRTDVDSVVCNGAAIFSKANINHLGICVYKRWFHDTIVTRLELVVNGSKGYKRLKNYFDLMTDGKSNIIRKGKSGYMDASVIQSEGNDLHVILLSDKRQRKSQLIILPITK